MGKNELKQLFTISIVWHQNSNMAKRQAHILDHFEVLQLYIRGTYKYTEQK